MSRFPADAGYLTWRRSVAGVPPEASPVKQESAMHFFEELPRRTHLSASLRSGTLIITGTDRGEAITVSLSGSNLKVSQSGQGDRLFPRSEVRRIGADLRGGSDRFRFASNLTIPTTVAGGTGNDTIYTGAGNDVVRPGTGRDVVKSGGGYDIVDYRFGSGNVNLRSNQLFGVEELRSGSGNDDIDVSGYPQGLVIKSGAGRDTIVGTPFNDFIFSGEGPDTVKAGAGNDQVYGGDSGDVILGEAGDDWLHGERGNDTIVGGLGRDVIEARGDGSTDHVYTNDDVDQDRLLLDRVDRPFADSSDILEYLV